MDAQLTGKRIHHSGKFSDIRFRGEMFVPALDASETFFRCRHRQPSCPLYAIWYHPALNGSRMPGIFIMEDILGRTEPSLTILGVLSRSLLP